MARIIRRKSMAIVLALAMVASLLPAMTIPAKAADVTTSFSGTLTTDNNFNRPDLSATGESNYSTTILVGPEVDSNTKNNGVIASTDGNSYNYFTVNFTPTETGNYKLAVTSALLTPALSYGYGTSTKATDDTTMYIYSNFNPSIPLEGLMYGQEDIAWSGTSYSDSNNFKSQIASGASTADSNYPTVGQFTAGTTYALVLTSYQSGVTGSINVDITGPGSVSISQNDYTSGYATAPTVTTASVSTYTATTATLGGNVTADGGASITDRGVVYSASDATPTIGESGVIQNTNGSGIGTFSESITDLAPNTTYYVRAFATNSAGTSYGSVVSFTTGVAVPTATTNDASGIVLTAATLNGTVNANNSSTTVTFEYGTSTSYGTTVAASPGIVAGTSGTSVSRAITGLTPNTTYHYRVVGVNAGGTTYGSDMTFSTDVTAPTISSASRDSDTQITVTLSEACQNLVKSNDGGFTVTKTGTSTTYVVSATAEGSDSSHVVLTVADMGAAEAAGVTVTYEAGTNGTITDTAGNALGTDGTGKTIAMWDTTAPDTTVTSCPPNPCGLASASFAFNSDDSTATFEASLDGAAFSPATSPKSFTGLLDGSHTFQVRALDAAGNVDLTPASYTWTVDSTGPTGTLSINNGAAYTTSLNVTLSITGSDGGGSGVSQMRFSLDGSSWSPWQPVISSKSGTLTASTYGTLTVYMQLEDNAGNISGNISDTIIYKSKPIAAGITKSGIEDTTVSFTSGDFPFTNADTTPLKKVKIKSLPSNGTLKLGSTAISAEDEISAGDLSHISFVPHLNWNGSTSFGWVGYTADGISTSEATVTITLAPDSDTSATASDNTVSVSANSVSVGAAVTITASGSRQSEAGAVIGDEKYVPATWSSSESGKFGSFTFSGGTYTAKYTPSAGGTYTITAAYQKMLWNGTTWENTTTDTKTISLTVNSSYSGSSHGSRGNNDSAAIVNSESKTVGTSQTTTNSSGQTVTIVTVDSKKLENILASEQSGATVTIPITGNSDVASGTLTGAMVKSMENKDAMLVVQTASGAYTLPASEINIDEVSQQLGTHVSLSDIKVTVSISKASASMTKVIESAAQDGGFTIMVPAVDYTITCTQGDRTVDVSSFNAYVERMIAIPDGVDPKKITTGVVIDPDGSTHHVPTRVTVIKGKYYAVMNSLTNSSYSVIWNPVEFSDVANHWAKDSINNMGSRMVVTGVGNKIYDPDRNMMRAEFAAIMVRALGLEPGTGLSGFGDVNTANWYCGYIKTAASYGIIKGYDNGNFGPNDTITREQAMTMITRAMTITKLSAGLNDSDISKLLSTFSDGASASAYAKESIAACLKTGITSGTSDTTISPQADITRAEVAVMVQRLLQKSGLI